HHHHYGGKCQPKPKITHGFHKKLPLQTSKRPGPEGHRPFATDARTLPFGKVSLATGWLPALPGAPKQDCRGDDNAAVKLLPLCRRVCRRGTGDVKLEPLPLPGTAAGKA